MTMYFSFPSRRCCHFAEWRMKAGENPMSNRVMRTKVKKHDNYELRKENHMSSRIPTPTMGEILMEEFMGPMNLSAYKLAQSIHVPTSRIQDILHNRRKISADTSIRLGRFFGVSDRFFLDMQNDIEVRELIEKLDGDITTIKPYTAVAM